MEQPPSTTEPPDNEQEVAVLIVRLGSWRLHEREEAEKGLRRLGMVAVDPLLAIMKQCNRGLEKRHRLARGIQWASLVLYGSYVAFSSLIPHWGLSYPHWIDIVGQGLFFAWMAYGIVLEGFLLTATGTHRYALEILMNTEDMRVIGLLAECLEFRHMSPKAGLLQLLPRLHASDTALLNKYQRACLYKRLRRNTRRGWFQGGENEKLTLAILKALEQVGDAEAVPYVRQAAKAAKSSEVREAAHTCLLFLMQRVSEAQPANTLLRAASSSPHPATTLLRASLHSAETPPQQLLRTVSTDEHSSTMMP